MNNDMLRSTVENGRVSPGMQPRTVYTLNTQQQLAHDALVAAILDDSVVTYKALLDGWAGTGKTFLINRVVETVKSLRPKIGFGMSAPTHKAVRALRRAAEFPDQIEFATIHSFLGLREVLRDDPKRPHHKITVYEREYNKDQTNKIDDIGVLIIDESSMLGWVLYNHIDDECRRRPNLKVIFMGDGLQIPPVNEREESPLGAGNAIPFVPAQRQSRNIHHFELTEIVRQGAGNPIIEYSSAIRRDVKLQSIAFDFSQYPPSESRGIEIIPRGTQPIRELIEKYFKTPEFEKNPDYIKAIAWQNKTVDYVNGIIREILHGTGKLPKLLDGEKLVLDKPIVKSDRIVLPNNEELTVIEHRVDTYEHTYKLIESNAFSNLTESEKDPQRKLNIKVYYVTVQTEEGRQYQVIILHEDSEREFMAAKEACRMAALKLARSGSKYESAEMWRQFFKMGEHFAWVKYNYCLTAHKSQGSTYDNCISMEFDIDVAKTIVGFEESHRIRYVAATRARHKLFIVK